MFACSLAFLSRTAAASVLEKVFRCSQCCRSSSVPCPCSLISPLSFSFVCTFPSTGPSLVLPACDSCRVSLALCTGAQSRDQEGWSFPKSDSKGSLVLPLALAVTLCICLREPCHQLCHQMNPQTEAGERQKLEEDGVSNVLASRPPDAHVSSLSPFSCSLFPGPNDCCPAVSDAHVTPSLARVACFFRSRRQKR